MAAVVVALYLAAVAVAAASGDLSALSVAATATTWNLSAWGDWLGPLVAGICGLNAWMLWQVLRGPALPRAEGLPRSVVWLRRLLYAGLAGDLVLWELVDELSGTVAYVASLVMWAATLILLVRVVSGVSARFRAIALALGLIGVLTPAPLVLFDGPGLQVISLLGLASLGATVMILIGQRRDGRWSSATIDIGRIALITPLVAPLAFPVLGFAFQGEELPFDGPGLVVSALGVFNTVWLARTAHELARPATRPAAGTAARPADMPAAGTAARPADMPAVGTATRPATGRGPRLSVAVALVLPLVVVGAEEDARLSFTGADEGCRERIRPYADTRPQDRWRAFLCLARDDTSTGKPMFPEDLPDQRVLAYGKQLCAVPGVEGRQELLRRAGGSAGTAGLGDALEFLCPGVVAQQRADEARDQAERERELAAWEAEMNARCADPWPKLRARRQGTAAYLLFEGGGYTVFDDRDSTEGAGGDIFKAIDDGFIDAAGSSAAITTYGENEPMCLTVKAFGAAPPLRLKGWDRVVEVGVVSRSGRLVVPSYPEGGDSGTIKPLPNLAVDGPGHYRMRVYARPFEWDEDDPDAPVEEHLIIVYPGRSAKKLVHRPWR
ncbi:hypothetical protein [Streptosporangium roseum]|uniref:DUF4153 domain-containing protein n=1 Tax=Streptosporangium roseum (strain ATCC 12428 / DSM 43021 / JCM 3005 / KCTC 9067 / NCIMB 10171 / NRRL 2505 / NI 9100) TaxID=479432 RepID=D2AUY4_STRRD|nr:hypothetical protein [Streptosporangium roseum]ACZ86846.1 hypothetical protein Sros_3930 [Streptosporangium roseum DSM 43021]